MTFSFKTYRDIMDKLATPHMLNKHFYSIGIYFLMNNYFLLSIHDNNFQSTIPTSIYVRRIGHKRLGVPLAIR